MTREEALYRVKGYLTDIIPIEDYSEVEEIIKALEQETCIQEKQANADKIDMVYIDGFKAGYSQARFDLEQQPCDDCISRQYLLNNCVVDKVTMPYVPVNKIKEAPPVTPTCEEREKGECPYYAG